MTRRIVLYVLAIGAIGALIWATPADRDSDETPVETPTDDAGVVLDVPDAGAPAATATDDKPGSQGRIVGRIVNEAGVGVAGVPIVVREHEPYRSTTSRWRPPIVMAQTTSAPNGTFRVDLVPDGTYAWVEAMPKPPLRGARTRVSLGAFTRVELVVRAGRTLRGRVVDERGRGLRAMLHLGHDMPQIATGPDGRFEIGVATEGRVYGTVTVPGRVRRHVQTFVPRADAWTIIALEDGPCSLRGTVISPDGSPVAGTRIDVQTGQDPWSADPVYMAVSDNAGRYRLEGLPVAPLATIRAEAEGFVPDTFGMGARMLAEGENTIDMVLQPAAVLKGTVLDAAGTPAVGLMVYAQERIAPDTQPKSCRVDETGAFRIDGLRAGVQVKLLGQGNGWYLPNQEGGPAIHGSAYTYETSAAQLTHTVQLTAKRGLEIAFDVRSADGGPVEDAAIHADPWRANNAIWRMGHITNTDARGRATLLLIPRVTWEFSARRGTRVGKAEDVLVLDTKPPDKPVVIVLQEGASVAGVVLDDEGPVAGASVSIGSEVTRTNPDGAFELRGLHAGGVRVYAGKGRRSTNRSVMLVKGQRVDDLTIELGPRTTISGVVLDANGMPVADKRVLASPPSEPRMGVDSALTDANGHFELDLPEPKTMVLVLEGTPVGEFESGDTEVRLTWTPPPPSKRITVRIVGPDGTPVPRIRVDVIRGKPQLQRSMGYDVNGGTWAFDAPPEGQPVKCTFLLARDARGRPLDLAPFTRTISRDDDDLVIQLERGRTLQGTVLDQDGQPAPDVGLVLMHPKTHRVKGSVKSGPDGTFRFEGIERRAYAIQLNPKKPYVRTKDWPRRGRAVGPDDTSLDLRVEKGRDIRFLVSGPDGVLAKGAQVSLYQRGKIPWFGKAYTDEQGRVTIPGFPPTGGAKLQVLTGGMDEPLAPHFELLERVDDAIHIRLGRAAWIEGTAFKADGTPAKDFGIDVEPEGLNSGESLPDGRVDAKGRFRVGPLRPGPYLVGLTSDLDGAFVRVVAPAAGIRLQDPHPAKLSGRMVGSPAQGWEIMWGNGRMGYSARSDAGGTFAIEETLPDEPGTLTALRRDGHRSWVVLRTDLRPSASPVELEISDALLVSGRLDPVPSKKEGRYLTLERPGGLAWVEVDDQGRFEFRGTASEGWRLVDRELGEGIDLLVQPGSKDVVLRWTRPDKKD